MSWNFAEIRTKSGMVDHIGFFVGPIAAVFDLKEHVLVTNAADVKIISVVRKPLFNRQTFQLTKRDQSISHLTANAKSQNSATNFL